MDARVADFVEKTYRTFNVFLRAPPQLLVHVAEFMRDVVPLIYDLNFYFETKTTNARQTELFDLTSKVIAVLLNVMLNNYHEFCSSHRMQQSTPWSAGMGLLAVMTQLVTIVDDHWTKYSALPQPLEMPHPASQDKSISLMGVVISASCVNKYTRAEMAKALEVLSMKWHVGKRISGLETYVKGLLHRWCILNATPDPTVLGTPDFTTSDYNKYVTDSMRMGISIIRMLWPFHFMNISTMADPVATLFDTDRRLVNANIEALREKLVAMSRDLSQTRGAKNDIVYKQLYTLVLNGDVERFAIMRPQESSKPRTVIMTVRPEIYPEMTRFHKTVLMPNMCKLMHEEDATYLKKYTNMEHMFASILKTYIMNSFLIAHDIDFFNDFVVYEMFLPVYYRQFVAINDPVLINMFSSMYVYYDHVLYACESVEMAIVVWIRILMVKMGGRLHNRDISSTLLSIVGTTQYREKTIETVTHVFGNPADNDIAKFYTAGIVTKE